MKASPHQTKRWTLVAVVVAAAFFAIALSRTIYEITSPSSFSWHIMLRKTYSIVAFALVGFLYVKVHEEWRGRPPGLLQTTLAIAAYSGSIEIGQAFTGSHEGHKSNLFDIFCGAVGGALGYALSEGIKRKAVER